MRWTSKSLFYILYIEFSEVSIQVSEKKINLFFYISISVYINMDLFCGLVVRVLGYRSGGPGSIPGTTRKKKIVGLERGPLNLVSTTEELLDRKAASPV
jgi:hypothetical protein